jgi:cysteine desulfurase
VGHRTYLDWNAGAPLLAEARAAVEAFLGGATGNPSSVHAEGRAVRGLVEQARADVAALVGAAPGAVMLTSGGSEANAAAIRGVLGAGEGPAGRVLVLPRVEHPSVLAAADQMRRHGAVVRWLPVGGHGVVDLTHLAELLAAETVALLCVQLANSETGVVQPVAEAAALARGCGVPILCDAVQAAGKVALDLPRLGVDLLSLSAHKLGGLPGSGALVGAGDGLEPLVPGSQERHRRGGTENVAGIVAFGAAARAAAGGLAAWSGVGALRDAFELSLCDRIAGTRVYGRDAERIPNTTCLGPPVRVPGGVMVAALDLRGFAVSSGSACSSGAERGSAVVEAMGFSGEDARRTLRVSLGPTTSAADVSGLVDALAATVAAGQRG